MRSLKFLALLVAISPCFICRISQADEREELRARAEMALKEAAELEERGEHERAAELKREWVRLMSVANPDEFRAIQQGTREANPERMERMRMIKEQLGNMIARENQMRESGASEEDMRAIRLKIESIKNTMDRLAAQSHTQPQMRPEMPPEMRGNLEKIEAAARRLEHIREAAKHLKMAEMHDMAHELMKRAEEMDRDVQQAKLRMAEQLKSTREMPAEPMPQFMIRELRHEVEQMRAEINELKEQLRNR